MVQRVEEKHKVLYQKSSGMKEKSKVNPHVRRVKSGELKVAEMNSCTVKHSELNRLQASGPFKMLHYTIVSERMLTKGFRQRSPAACTRWKLSHILHLSSPTTLTPLPLPPVSGAAFSLPSVKKRRLHFSTDWNSTLVDGISRRPRGNSASFAR